MTVDDSPGFLAEMFAKLDLTLDRLNGSIAKQIQRDNAEWAASAEQPRFMPIHGVLNVPASGFGVIAFDNKGPDQGWTWHLRKLAIGGLTTTTVAAGRADVFVSAADLRFVDSLARIGIQDWRDFFSALPDIHKYGTGEIFMRHNEELYVVISGATNGQQYVVSGMAQQFQESAASQEWAQ